MGEAPGSDNSKSPQSAHFTALQSYSKSATLPNLFSHNQPKVGLFNSFRIFRVGFNLNQTLVNRSHYSTLSLLSHKKNLFKTPLGNYKQILSYSHPNNPKLFSQPLYLTFLLTTGRSATSDGCPVAVRGHPSASQVIRSR